MAKTKPAKRPRLEPTLPALGVGRRDPLQVPSRVRQPGLAYRWVSVAPGADPNDLDARVEEMTEKGWRISQDPAGGPVRRRGAVLMEIEQKVYDARMKAQTELNQQANRAQAEAIRRNLQRQVRGRGGVLGEGLQHEPGEELLSEHEHFVQRERPESEVIG